MSGSILSVIMIIGIILTSCITQSEVQISDDIVTVTPEQVKYSDILMQKNSYNHKADSFTQGLFFYNDTMYETTGRYGKSKLYKNIDIETGEAESVYLFPEEIFAEGSVVYKDKLYVLTYRENEVYVFNPETLEHEATYDYPRQGWGLTTDGEYLIASDGTSMLYYMDENLKEVKTVTVKNNGTPVEKINELEYINGEIWANVWFADSVFVINPEDGNVKRIIDFSGLYKPMSDDSDAVLNGIAYNKNNGKIYITGKLWEKIFEFELIDN